MTPEELARETIQDFLMKHLGKDLSRAFVPVTVFNSQLDYDTVSPEEHPEVLATLEAHHRYVEVFCEELKLKTGLAATRIPLDAATYFRWLAKNQRRNNRDSRALFLVEQFTAAKDKA